LLTRRPDFLPPNSTSSAAPFVAAPDGPEGAYAFLSEPGLQVLFLPGTTSNDELAAVIPLDGDLRDRLDALTRLTRTLSGRAAPGDTRMTAEQRRRFRLKLRAADGQANGATYREIATAFYGRSRVEADPWKTSPLRDAVIAFVEGGLALIEGGYRQLLRQRRRS
jgi:hypothetical protein